MIRKLLCWLGLHEWQLLWYRDNYDRIVGSIICVHCLESRDWFFWKFKGKIKR